MSRAFLPLLVTAIMIVMTPGAHSAETAPPNPISDAINTTGIDLFRAQAQASPGNLLLSPYSVELALAMAFAGADGDTRAEMQRVLHFPAEDAAIHSGFASLAAQLRSAMDASKLEVANAKKFGGPSTPLEINVANRLFGQRGYAFRKPFLSTLTDLYHAPLDELDFRMEPESARGRINGWVAQETRQKIHDIVPPGAVKSNTRLALANAIYLRAAWASQFSKSSTKPEPFFANGKEKVDVPTMVNQSHFGYLKSEGYAAITLKYAGGALQFLILLPEAADGLSKVEESMNADVLARCAKAPAQDVILHLPKFTLAPEVMPLGSQLQALGMKTAFDVPEGSANFDRMAPRKPDDYLKIGEVFHKTWLALDEKGTEAAAATVVTMAPTSAAALEPPKPIEVKVDHPFLFAIQHVPTGTCIFLGRVVDPR